MTLPGLTTPERTLQRSSHPGAPRWVKVAGIVVFVLIVVLVVSKLAGVEHGPGRHAKIGAIQAALDKVALGLLDDHARHCVMSAEGEEQVDKTDELMAAVGRPMRRG